MRTNPHGKTKLLCDGGAPAANEQQPADARETPFAAEAIHIPRTKPQRAKPGIPLSHGHVSEQQVAEWRRMCRRRSNTWTERDEAEHQERWGD